MAVLQNERDKTLQATDPRLIATSVTISSDNGALFHEPLAPDPIIPANMTLTGNTTVFTSPTIKWYYANNEDMIWHDFDISGNNIGSTRFFTSATFLTHLGTNGTKVFYKATAEQTGFQAAESPLFEITFSSEGGVGADGEDAYHIRLDNESRFVLFKYDGTAKPGQMPLTAQAYITKGASDVTVGSGFITYSIQSVSGATGASINASGVIQVTGVTQETNYVEIKAVIAEPGFPTLNAYKKLYIYKQQEESLELDVTITQDNYYFSYADDTSTTNTAAWTTITFTAEVQGYPGALVTWSASTYTAAGTEISGTETIFTANGNTCTVSDAQFVARGGAGNKLMKITAAYTAGGVTAYDSVFIIRDEGVLGILKRIFSSNTHFTYSTDTSGVISSTKFNEETTTLQVIDVGTGSIVDVTDGWTFTATSSPAGVGIDINGTGAGPYAATTVPVILKLTSLPAGVTSGTITIVATKDGDPASPLSYSWQTFSVSLPASSGHTLVFDPDGTIILPVDSSNLIVGYETACRTIKVMKGSIDDSASWVISKVDGPGVTSTLTGNELCVTNFSSVVTSVSYPSGAPLFNSPTNFGFTPPILWWKLFYTTSGKLIAVGQPNGSPYNWYSIVSTDHGATWSTPSQIPNPHTGTAWTQTYSAGWSVIYSVTLDKVILLSPSPYLTAGVVFYTSDGITWDKSVSLPISTETWKRLTEDVKTGKIYAIGSNGSKLAYSTNLTSWTLVTTNIPVSSCVISVMNGKAIAVGSYDPSTVCYVYTSTNLTSWTSIAGNGGNGTYSGGVPGYYYGGLDCTDGSIVILPSNKSLTVYKGDYGFVYSSDCINTKNVSLNGGYINGSSAALGSGFFGKILGSYLFTDYGGKIYYSNPGFASTDRVSLSGTALVASQPPYNYLSLTNITSYYGGREFPKYNGSYYIPTLLTNSSYNGYNGTSFIRGSITPGNNGSDSYINITATANNPDYGVLTGTIIVKKGTYVGDVYSLVINPGEIRLPSTSDGKVYSSAYTASPYTTLGPSSVRCTVLKNGIMYTGGITGSITATTGVTTQITGNGTNTGILSVSNMTDGATEPASITGSVTIDGVIGPALEVLIPVVKVRDGTVSGPLPGALVSAWHTTETSITIKFLRKGTIEIKRGSGSFVYALDWYAPISPTGTPGDNFWLKVIDNGSDTSDILQPVGSLNTYLQLNTDREFYLSNATTGHHNVRMKVYLATSSGGANAMIGNAELELDVP